MEEMVTRLPRTTWLVKYKLEKIEGWLSQDELVIASIQFIFFDSVAGFYGVLVANPADLIGANCCEYTFNF